MKRPVSEVLDQEFLIARAKILELAAILDRLDRAEGSVTSNSKYELLKKGIAILAESEEGRAERLQLLFSRPYEPAWRQHFGV
ncbi:MAG: hypothetical protein ACK517_03670 [bacterium]|jgi:hypothetical protein